MYEPERTRSESLGWKREWINDCKKNNYKKLYTVLSCLGVFTFCTCCKILIVSCVLLLLLSCLLCNCCWLTVCIVVVVLCVLLSYVYLLYCVDIAFFLALDAGLLARNQYWEGPATGHFDTGFSWFTCVYKQMLRWFPRFQVANKCFSCSPADLNLVVTDFMFCLHVK